MVQDWPEKELVILDDLDDRSFPTAPPLDGVRYFVSEKRLKIGEKRNRLCELAKGKIICHLDDDDYSAPGRIADQVDRLLSTGAMLAGYNEMVFQDENAALWMFSEPGQYVHGTSMMYRREFWERHPFRQLQMGEDTLFLAKAVQEKSLAMAPAGSLMLGRMHAGNTIQKKPVGSRWTRIAA